MVFDRVGVNVDVVEIYMYEYSVFMSKYVNHKALEGRWGVQVADLHNPAKESSKDRRESGFPDVGFRYSNLLEGVR